MKPIIKTGLVMLLLAVVSIALSAGFLRAHAATHANVVVASESRPLDASIVNIVVSGPIDLELKQAATPAMIVKGDAGMLVRVTARVEGNTLYLGTRGIIVLIRQPLKVELSLPALEKLQMQGSGDSQVRGFRGNRLELLTRGSGDLSVEADYQQVQASSGGSGNLTLMLGNSDSLELAMHGSGDARIKGQSKVLNANLNGSGDLDAHELKANRVSVTSSGSADVTVFALQSIMLRLMGSGDATIYGNPASRNIERKGSGEIYWQ